MYVGTMSKKKPTYFCAIVITVTVFLCDVNAKSHTSHSHHTSGYHGESSSGKHQDAYIRHPGSTLNLSSYQSSRGLSGHPSSNSNNLVPYTSSDGWSGRSSSYPVSPGLSGRGTRSAVSYSTSNGTSGNGANNPVTFKPVVSYPTSNGLSGTGNQSHSYPSSNSLSGSRSLKPVTSYPSSNSLSGNGASFKPIVQRPISNKRLSSNTGNKKPGTSYPSSNSGLSGSGSRRPGTIHSKPPVVSYPISNGGLSGNKPSVTSYPTISRPQYTYPTSNSHNSYRGTRPNKIKHHHYIYEYKPPTVIHYTPSYGTAASYPVYTGQYIPPYVYEYRSSENKYRQLLAGLALYNLGEVSSSHTKDHYHKTYVTKPDEICMFGVKYRTGSYDEMTIDCRMITNFIFVEESKPRMVSTILNQTTVMKNVNVMLPNGTLVQEVDQVVNQMTMTNNYVPNEVMLPNGTLVNAEIAKTLQKTGEAIPRPQTLLPNGTLVDPVSDPKFYGSPVNVKSDMECYVIKITRFSNMKTSVPCGLLQTYAIESLRKNSADAFKSSLAAVMVAVTIILL